jgi:hypothetical protein
MIWMITTKEGRGSWRSPLEIGRSEMSYIMRWP